MYVTQGLHRSLQQRSDAPATIFSDRRRTVGEQADRVARVASALRDLGVVDGESVGVLALNSDRFAELLLAVPWANGVLSLLNVRWGPAEITRALADSDARILCVDDAFAPLVPTLTDRCPDVRTVVYIGEAEQPPRGMLGYEDLVAGYPPCDDARRGGDEVAALIYTGGTTGVPKGVLLSHSTLCGTALATEVAAPSDRSSDSRSLIVTSMAHFSGLMASLLQTTFGGTQIIIPAFEPAAVLRAIHHHHVTHAFLVPTMLRQVLDHPAAADHDLSSLRHLMYGGAPISEQLMERAAKALPGAAFQQVYASSEMGLCTVLGPADHTDHASRGRLRSAGRAVVGVELRVVGPDGDELPPGDVGEIVARGQMMVGYHNKPDATAEALRGGWLHTGDLGHLDRDGYLYVVDRLKDMIVTGGSNVYSAEVENALASHPAIAACAVIGVPDESLGERVHAVIVLRDGTIDLDGLQRHCGPLIAVYKVPRSFEVVEALPLSPAGKPLKRELRKPYWAHLDRQVN